MRRLIEVALFTDDVPRLVAFYEGLLEAAPTQSSPSRAVFELGDVHLLIHVRMAEEPDFPPFEDHVAFAAHDVDAAAGRLPEEEVLLGPRDYDWGRSAYLTDPDGRMVELHRPE